MSNNIYNILNKFNKLNESAKPAEQAPKAKTLLESNMEQVLNEKYLGFKKVEKAAEKGGAENPAAVAAAIGRKKYGKKKFQKAAATGKKMGESEVAEVAPPGKKAERMVKHIKAGYAKDGKLTDKEKAIAYATAWKAKKAGKVEEQDMEEGVDHSSIAANLAKLARVIKSVQTPEQFAVAQKYAQRMSGTIMKHQHDNSGFGSGLRANLGVMRDISSDLKAKAKELGIAYDPLAESWDAMLKDVKKKHKDEKGTGKFDKKKSDKGTVYTRKYDPKSGETEDDGKDGEGNEKAKRGRGRPKKTNESTSVIDRMVAEMFEGTVEKTPTGLIHRATDKYGAGEDSQLTYEQDHLKQHLGSHLYAKLEKAMQLGDTFPDDLYDNLYEYYLDQMPYGTAKARTGDPYQWIQEKLNTVFPELSEGRYGQQFAQMPSGQDILPEPAPQQGTLGKIGSAIKTGAKAVGKALAGPNDAELLQQLQNKRTMEEELSQLTKLAGMAEAKKAKPDFLDVDKDGNKKETFKKAVKDKKKIDECMGMVGTGGEQEGTMNISTNMSTDGTKNVTITASGSKADELAQMLQLAGVGGGVAAQPEEEPAGVATVEIGANDETELPQEYEASETPNMSSDEEDEMDEGNAFGNAVRKAKADGVQPGEKVNVGGKEYPVKEEDDEEEEMDEDASYEANTTPEEHVYPTQTQTKGGDGDVAGQEKKMNPTKPTWKNGDNAMSESAALKLMKEYESILIRK